MKRTLSILLALLLAFSAVCVFASCGETKATEPATDNATGNATDNATEAVKYLINDGVLTVAMECAYAPYNWTQYDDSNGAVAIKGASGEYANGYDVMIAKKIAEANNLTLEIVRLDWDSLIPAVQTGIVDCVIAGQSMTEDRMEEVDFAGPYLYATIVCLVRNDSALASATGLSDLAGVKCTSQMSTIWYDTCLPQIPDADIKEARESAPAMLMSLVTGDVDLVCTDMPTAQAALIAYPELKLLDFGGTGNDFSVDAGDINIGISIKKGNTELLNRANAALAGMTAEDFNDIMNEAIRIQPLSEE